MKNGFSTYYTTDSLVQTIRYLMRTSGVGLSPRVGLAADHSKAIKEARLVERKVYFGCQQLEGRGDTCPKADSPSPTHWQSGGESFYRLREGATGSKSTVSSGSHLEIGHQLFDQHRLGCFMHSLQFQGRCVPVSWREVLELFQLTSWLPWCMYSTSPPGGSFHIYMTAYRVWLRILSIALEKELEVADFAQWPSIIIWVSSDCCFCIFSLLIFL